METTTPTRTASSTLESRIAALMQLDVPSDMEPRRRAALEVAEIVRTPGEVVALLCACADARSCHRTVIAKALSERWFGGGLEIREVVSERHV